MKFSAKFDLTSNVENEQIARSMRELLIDKVITMRIVFGFE